MRAVLPVASLLLASFSLLLDLIPLAPGSRLWLQGACRFDQLYSGIDAVGITLGSLSTLLATDPANPLVWCSYANLLSTGGEPTTAAAAFDHAVALGPSMAPVLMRVANFDFTHARRDHGMLMAHQILLQTTAFDQILFSYLLQPGVPIPGGVKQLLGVAIPATPRAAQSWLDWVRANGSDLDLLATWYWMRQHQLFAAQSAAHLAWTLWERKSYRAAQALWAQSLGSARGDYLCPQLLANRRFEYEPNASPFDWALTPTESVVLARREGLEIRFSGTANVDFSQVRQFTTVSPGRYRLDAEVESEGLTTDQRPFFHLFDPAHPNAVNVVTPPFPETLPRGWISLTFTVQQGTEALAVQLERRPSQHFDNRIAGTLNIYQVSLRPTN